MFTGIIEETGSVKGFAYKPSGAEITIECKEITKDIKIGDSIAVNGVCETASWFDKNIFKADVSAETLKVTNFNSLKQGDIVNLERALTLSSRLGGHIVSGHVDCTAKLLSVIKLNDFYELSFELNESFEKYIVYKGSVTVNGISLTIADVNGKIFKTAVIPHTYKNTNLQYLKTGDDVNIETDILGRYVEKLLYVNDNNNRINENFLKENGFL